MLPASLMQNAFLQNAEQYRIELVFLATHDVSLHFLDQHSAQASRPVPPPRRSITSLDHHD